MLPFRVRVDLGVMAMKKPPHCPKLQHYWNLSIRLFRVISRTLVGDALLLCRDAVSVFYSPNRQGKRTIMFNFKLKLL